MSMDCVMGLSLTLFKGESAGLKGQGVINGETL